MKAILRQPGPELAQCELTHLAREPLDVEVARLQHGHYRDRLKAAGVEVVELPSDPRFPDGVFVEDTAVVTPEFRALTRPGAPSRSGEVAAVGAALGAFGEVVPLKKGTLDGGDVLRLGKTLYVGVGGRSNGEGAAELERVARPFGYRVQTVPLSRCLHLKTAVTEAAPGLLLGNSQWVDPAHFPGMEWQNVHPSEPFAGNCLRVGTQVWMQKAHSATAERLRARGLEVVTLPFTELAKAEAGLTCCCVFFDLPG